MGPYEGVSGRAPLDRVATTRHADVHPIRILAATRPGRVLERDHSRCPTLA